MNLCVFLGGAPNQSTTTFRKARVPEDSTSYATMLAGGCYRPPDVMVTHNWSNKYLHLMAAIFSEVQIGPFFGMWWSNWWFNCVFFFVEQDSHGAHFFFFLGGGRGEFSITMKLT